MKLLILADGESDFSEVPGICGAEISLISMENAIDMCFDAFDSFVLSGRGKVLDPRLRVRLMPVRTMWGGQQNAVNQAGQMQKYLWE